jgi:hypothetical protein
MLLPQLIKRMFFPRRSAEGRVDPAGYGPGAETAPARSGKDALKATVDTQKEEATRSDSAPPPHSSR